MCALKGESVPSVIAKRVEVSDIFQTSTRLDACLVRYVQACKDFARRPQNLSMCSDKASVAGFSLQCSLVCLSDGTALVPPPQVATLGSLCLLNGVSGPSADRADQTEFLWLGEPVLQELFPGSPSHHVTWFSWDASYERVR